MPMTRLFWAIFSTVRKPGIGEKVLAAKAPNATDFGNVRGTMNCDGEDDLGKAKAAGTAGRLCPAWALGPKTLV